jgi:hypothetical protein
VREPKICLGQVFNFEIDSFASYQDERTVLVQPFLELKTRHRVRPATRSLSMHSPLCNRKFSKIDTCSMMSQWPSLTSSGLSNVETISPPGKGLKKLLSSAFCGFHKKNR